MWNCHDHWFDWLKGLRTIVSLLNQSGPWFYHKRTSSIHRNPIYRHISYERRSLWVTIYVCFKDTLSINHKTEVSFSATHYLALYFSRTSGSTIRFVCKRMWQLWLGGFSAWNIIATMSLIIGNKGITVSLSVSCNLRQLLVCGLSAFGFRIYLGFVRGKSRLWDLKNSANLTPISDKSSQYIHITTFRNRNNQITDLSPCNQFKNS